MRTFGEDTRAHALFLDHLKTRSLTAMLPEGFAESVSTLIGIEFIHYNDQEGSETLNDLRESEVDGLSNFMPITVFSAEF